MTGSSVFRRSWPQAPRKISSPRSALALITDRFSVAAAIERKQSRGHVAMKRGVWPIADARDESVLERMDDAIFDMAASQA
jgi:hypothetical protein